MTVTLVEIIREFGSLGLLALVLVYGARRIDRLTEAVQGLRGQLHGLSLIVIQRTFTDPDEREEALALAREAANGGNKR